MILISLVMTVDRDQTQIQSSYLMSTEQEGQNQEEQNKNIQLHIYFEASFSSWSCTKEREESSVAKLP